MVRPLSLRAFGAYTSEPTREYGTPRQEHMFDDLVERYLSNSLDISDARCLDIREMLSVGRTYISIDHLCTMFGDECEA